MPSSGRKLSWNCRRRCSTTMVLLVASSCAGCWITRHLAALGRRRQLRARSRSAVTTIGVIQPWNTRSMPFGQVSASTPPSPHEPARHQAVLAEPVAGDVGGLPGVVVVGPACGEVAPFVRADADLAVLRHGEVRLARAGSAPPARRRGSPTCGSRCRRDRRFPPRRRPAWMTNNAVTMRSPSAS